MTLIAGVLTVAALFQAGPKTHFDVNAEFRAARRNAPAEVAVQFVATDPDVKINEFPAPKLKLTAGPATVIVPPKATAPAADKGAPTGSEPGHYLDLTLPVTFPVTLDAAATRGAHDGKGTVTYFYCSKREGWCRKGTAEVAFPIAVP